MRGPDSLSQLKSDCMKPITIKTTAKGEDHHEVDDFYYDQ